MTCNRFFEGFAILVALMYAGPSFAQRGGGGAAGGGSPFLITLDTNGDRILSREEIAAATASLQKLDLDGDGQLTRQEYQLGGPGRGAQGQGRAGGQSQGRGQGMSGQQADRGPAQSGGSGQAGQRGQAQQSGAAQGGQQSGVSQVGGPQRQRPPRTPIVLTEGQLPDVDAHLPDGTPIKVRDLIKGKYTVIKTGCLTCPEFLIAYKELEATAADYKKMGVQFYFIYQSLRHPEREGYVQPQNTKERLLHVAEAKERLGTTVPWIMDTIDDSFRVAMRSNSNSIFVIGPDSEIAYAADRMNGDGLRRALVDLVGPVENPTSAEDLEFPEMPRFPPKNITNDIRVERPQGLVILKTTPTKPDDTYYVKMRAEAEKSVLETGKGDLYLGFFPDPIHDAHWNNLTPGMKYEFELPEGVTIHPPTGEAKKGPGDSDTEPRQFKLKVDADKTPGDVNIKIHYYACAPGMCVALSHEYVIAFEDANRNSRTYSFNRGQGAPGGVPKPSNRQYGPGREGGQQGARQSGGAAGGQRGGAAGGQRARGGAAAGGQASRGGQGARPRDKVRPRDTEFKEKFPEGSTLPDSLQLYNVHRELVTANSIFDAEYTVIVGGCLTCPEYRNSYPEIEAVAADYRDKGVQFYFLFQTLTHPENWGFVQPTSIQERFAQVEHAKKLLKTSIPWLTDTMDNEMKQHFAMTPNSQFVFDREGKIVHRDSWGRGSSLRESLEKLVGPSAKITTVPELNLPQFGSHKTSAAEMLIERKRLDGVATPLRVAAGGVEASVDVLQSLSFGESNRYAKLRPEADQQLLQTGTGQLYLGFRQDPVLGAAWNNLAAPPRYRVSADGVTVTPATAESPKLSVDSDTEPREFLVDVENWEAGKPITVEIQYFACNKKLGWCKPVEQKFTVWLEEDGTAGMVSGRTHFPGGRGGAGRQGGGSRGGQRPDAGRRGGGGR